MHSEPHNLDPELADGLAEHDTDHRRVRVVQVGEGVAFGPDHLVVIAGPCAVESIDQLRETARSVREVGASLLRGGAFKPRTRPESFQGLGADGLKLLAEVGTELSMPVVTEVLDPRDVDLVGEVASMFQIGSRNMQNSALLREVGKRRLPVLLKRAASATLDEFLGAADYIREEGNDQVVLCERGLRSFDPKTRYLLDLAAVPALHAMTDLPVVVDPSHGTGRRELVRPMARAAVVAGADGVMVEVHPRPEDALSDGPQALRPKDFSALMADIRALAPMLRRAVPGTPVPGCR
ncbi:MAG: 3-deoxy-7-phosphoheptulonate synthase [Planctomycetota bacterium]